MTKGFVFSLDVMLAVLILSFFVATFSFFSAQARVDPYSIYTLQKQADDALIVLDKSGELATLNQTRLTTVINSMTDFTEWNMEIEYFNYSHPSGFESAGNISFGGVYSTTQKVVYSQRVFLVFNGSTIQHYGVAKMRLWSQ